MKRPLEQKLAELENTSVTVLADDIPDADGTAAIVVRFSNGVILRAAYWRFIQEKITRLSSFDHGQQYGLPAPIDAKEQIARLLDGKVCADVKVDLETADIVIRLGEGIKLQIFNFTGYEVWYIHFPDGAGQYCNYALFTGI